MRKACHPKKPNFRDLVTWMQGSKGCKECEASGILRWAMNLRLNDKKRHLPAASKVLQFLVRLDPQSPSKNN